MNTWLGLEQLRKAEQKFDSAFKEKYFSSSTE